MNTDLMLYTPIQRLGIGEGVHALAQAWGVSFLRRYLKTGESIGKVKLSDLGGYALENCNHLWRCFECDECRDIRALIDATDLASAEEYVYFYHAPLLKLHILC